MGPLPVINGVIYNPYKWPYKWVAGVITLLIEVIFPFITGRGPPCSRFVNMERHLGLPAHLDLENNSMFAD